MSAEGDEADGARLRALIVILWRSACGLAKRLPRPRPTTTVRVGRFSFAAARAAADARSAWTAGHGINSKHGYGSDRGFRPGRSSACSAARRRAVIGSLRLLASNYDERRHLRPSATPLRRGASRRRTRRLSESGGRRSSAATKTEPCRRGRTPDRKVLLLADELPAVESSQPDRRRCRSRRDPPAGGDRRASWVSRLRRSRGRPGPGRPGSPARCCDRTRG
jgi:hypothetical protein